MIWGQTVKRRKIRNIPENVFILFFRSCPISLHAVKKFKVIIYGNTDVLNFVPKNVVETIDFLAQFLYIYILEAVLNRNCHEV